MALREKADQSDPAAGELAAKIIKTYNKLTSKEDIKLTEACRKGITMKLLALVAELIVFPESTLLENAWAQRVPLILAMNRPGMDSETHAKMVSFINMMNFNPETGFKNRPNY